MNDVQEVNKYVPDYLVTPGEVLEDYLEFAGLTQASLAERTGLSKKTINEIIKAKSAISSDTALSFERTLNRPAHFWSNLERQYQEDKTRLADRRLLQERLHWLDIFPVNEMAKLGWIKRCKEKTEQLNAILHFFGIASPELWEKIWVRNLQVDFRKLAPKPDRVEASLSQTEKSKKDMGIISAWLRQGEIIAKNRGCSKFDKQEFQNSLTEIRSLTTAESNVFIPKLESICASCGVAIVFIPALSRLGIYGATRWFNNKYIMQLSLYLKSNDHLWFTIFHEACHIIKHSRREFFIEGKGLENEKTGVSFTNEDEADIFAQDTLIPPDLLKHFLASCQRPTLYQIENFAKTIGIAPGIVVGRLQHDGVLPMNYGNGLKVGYEWVMHNFLLL